MADDKVELIRRASEQSGPRNARGFEAVEALIGEFDSAWTSHRTKIEDMRVMDDKRVLVFSVEHFRGRDEMELSAPAAAIFTVEAGKIVRWEAFCDRQNALQAANLAE